MSYKIDTDKVTEIIKDCAAEYIIPRFKELKDHHIDTKTGPGDLVTIADIETEQALDRILSAEYAGSIVVGEEGISEGTKDIKLLQNTEGVIWVVDPVDGTYNFVHGKDEFCCIVACVINGQTQYGWIYDILGDRVLFTERGAGTALDGIEQNVSSPRPLSECAGFAGRRYFPETMRPHIDTLKEQVYKLNSLGCVGHEYLRIVSGVKDFGIYSRIRPWDHLVGALAVQEAGGLVQKWDGSDYTPQDDFGGLLVASHGDLMEHLTTETINNMIEEYNSNN